MWPEGKKCWVTGVAILDPSEARRWLGQLECAHDRESSKAGTFLSAGKKHLSSHALSFLKWKKKKDILALRILLWANLFMAVTHVTFFFFK